MRDLLVKDGIGQEMAGQFGLQFWLPRKSQSSLHAANLRHGTDGFTSPPKESMLWIFSPKKIRWLRPGLNPQSWVPEASMLTTRPPKMLRGSRGIALLILDLSARKGWVVSITPQSLYPWERPSTHCTGDWEDPRASLYVCEKSHPHRDLIPRP
jgi:hypothetical protein